MKNHLKFLRDPKMHNLNDKAIALLVMLLKPSVSSNYNNRKEESFINTESTSSSDPISLSIFKKLI